MARSYRRDSSGRFSGGGGGGGSKGARSGGGTLAARSSLKRSRGKLATNQTSAQRGAVTRASNKLKASKTENQRQLTAKRAGVIGKPKGLKPSVGSRAVAAATKRPAKMSKAAPNAAKARYKAATSKVRELKMYRGGRTDATVKNAKAAVSRMERQRGTGRNRVPKVAQAVARAAAATFTAGQVARRSVDRAMKGRKRR
jgi:hypothetical protein